MREGQEGCEDHGGGGTQGVREERGGTRRARQDLGGGGTRGDQGIRGARKVLGGSKATGRRARVDEVGQEDGRTRNPDGPEGSNHWFCRNDRFCPPPIEPHPNKFGLGITPDECHGCLESMDHNVDVGPPEQDETRQARCSSRWTTMSRMGRCRRERRTCLDQQERMRLDKRHAHLNCAHLND